MVAVGLCVPEPASQPMAHDLDRAVLVDHEVKIVCQKGISITPIFGPKRYSLGGQAAWRSDFL